MILALVLVVSKDNAVMRFFIFQSSRQSITSFAIASSVPEVSIGTPGSFDTPPLETRTGRVLIVFPVSAESSIPSQWMVSEVCG